jgi:hypothetical protein
MSGRIKRLVLALFLAVLAVGGERTIYPDSSQDIVIRPLQLDPGHKGERRIGDLIFLSAWELGSRNENFGGISALTALKDGRFVGVSDAGTLIGFGLTSNEQVDRPFIASLPDSQGADKSYKDRDSEGIAYDPGSGQFWVSYEANHAIRRFSRSFARMTGVARPAVMQSWPGNKGAESIIRLRDGRFLVIAENLENDLTHRGLLFSGDPVEPGTAIKEFLYRPPAGYRVTDGAQLPDGRLALLQRHIGFPDGFSAKISMLDQPGHGTESIGTGKVIATLAAPLLVDNMEGIAISTDAKDTILWLISDNNFSIFQRTLLMKFRLSERGAKKNPKEVSAPGFDSL